MDVIAPPRETLIVTAIVLSNGVPLPGEPLRAKLWPSSGLKPGPFVVQLKLTADSSADGVPWEIVVEDATSHTIAAQLRPTNLPRLDWSVSPSAANLGKLSVTREARTFEVARALQTSGGGRGRRGGLERADSVAEFAEPPQPRPAGSMPTSCCPRIKWPFLNW